MITPSPTDNAQDVTANPDRALPRHSLTSVILAMACAGIGGGIAPRGRGFDLDYMDDSLDTLAFIMGDDRPRDSMGFRHPHQRARREIAFIDTPKPLSKRRARRLRGKAAA
ncbi:hypothetical protein C8J45_103337 [Sphingomonas sp. PP-CE-3G-477]|uniref:hypothetical protein n=1 Tax=Sphingomonas sp. PP-CE-3G-477 TaxID=2135660 RepID=UPI000D3FBDAA|nr:hypothetical protein [Sphingomonas sp. PP-CE-3G-477]PTQ64487.1 hypothetical protein C8J45_103337 [Sphingomonas sp. PP-CE-3G-477]